jgi:diguanylate cyclase (GGDEF)-like protein
MYFDVIYIELNLVCVLILLFLAYRLNSNIDQRTSNLNLRNTMLAVIGVLFLDVVLQLLEGAEGVDIRVIIILALLLYHVMTQVTGIIWLMYVIGRLQYKIKLGRRGKVILLVPVGILVALVVASVWTGWFFRIDGSNNVTRGPDFAVQIILSYLYFGLSFVFIVRSAIKAKTRQRRRDTRLLLMFFVLPVAGSIAGIFFRDVPCVWPCATLSLLMIFVYYKEDEVSTDSLTGLNNRRQFDRRLRDMIRQENTEETLFLFIMDINGFKRINDTYGHYEGDKALAETANILKRAIGGTPMFLARYGGDEFAILGFLKGMDEAESLKLKIQRYFADSNVDVSRDYDIVMGVGYYEYGPGHGETIQQLIAGADKNLYADKERLKRIIP